MAQYRQNLGRVPDLISVFADDCAQDGGVGEVDGPDGASVCGGTVQTEGGVELICGEFGGCLSDSGRFVESLGGGVQEHEGVQWGRYPRGEDHSHGDSPPQRRHTRK